MKRSWLALPLSVILFFVAASITSAGPTIEKILNKKELVIGTAGDIPPLNFKTKDGKLKGLDIDLGQILAEAMEVHFKVVEIPFNDLIPALESGRIDMIISSMTITPQRNLQVAYVGPYFLSGQALLTTKEIAAAITGPADIDKPEFLMAVPPGSTSEIVAKLKFAKAKTVAVKSTKEALSLLLQQKVMGVMADYPFCSVEALRYRDKGLVSTSPFTSESLGIAVRADDPLLVNLLQNYLSILQVNGQLQGMIKSWFEDPGWLKELPDDGPYL